jgi:hypothetical protein
VSAFAADRHVSSMNDRAVKASLPSITTRPSAAEKARFAWLAERAGMSESALALVAIRKLLDPDCEETKLVTAVPERIAATDRVTIRLRPGDGAAIAHRAAERGMSASAYLAALARAQVRTNPPLPAGELRALKAGVMVLAGVGRALAQAARNPALTGPERETLRRDLGHTRAVVAALEKRVRDVAKAALVAWETGYD